MLDKRYERETERERENQLEKDSLYVCMKDCMHNYMGGWDSYFLDTVPQNLNHLMAVFLFDEM